MKDLFYFTFLQRNILQYRESILIVQFHEPKKVCKKRLYLRRAPSLATKRILNEVDTKQLQGGPKKVTEEVVLILFLQLTAGFGIVDNNAILKHQQIPP